MLEREQQRSRTISDRISTARKLYNQHDRVSESQHRGDSADRERGAESAGVPRPAPGNDADSIPPHVPYVILLSESPALQGAFSLALHLAQLAHAASAPVLVADLAPAASRLGQTLRGCSRFSHLRDSIQPLWIDSTHGRTLHSWNRSGSIDLIAQLGSEFPTSSQMPRIIEQLIRHLSQPRLNTHGEYSNYHYVFLLSEQAGVPLDSAAWKSADEVWLFHDPKHSLESAAFHMAARLSSGPSCSQQQLVLVNKLPPKLADWARRQRLEVDRARHPALLERWPLHRSFNLTWPILSGRLTQSLSRAARELWHIMSPEQSGSRSTRQAS
jgi:hypothetical protein